MKIVVACMVAALFPVAAYAQVPGSVPGATGSLPLMQSPMHDSPELQRIKLDRAKAIKADYFRWQAEDGGKISPYHLAVVRQEARDALSGSGHSIEVEHTGALAPR